MAHNGCTNEDIGTETIEISTLDPSFVLTMKLSSTEHQLTGFSAQCMTASVTLFTVTKPRILDG